MEPVVIIHGGVGGSARGDAEKEAVLIEIARRVYEVLCVEDARSAAFEALRLLEDAPAFNAGCGSKRQSDGVIRMSASIMDGETNRFAGVINVRKVQPVRLLKLLMEEPENTVLAGSSAEAYAVRKGLADDYDPYVEAVPGGDGPDGESKSGTVGVVALDAAGRIVAGTSTGGIGDEIPGRVSDAGTVAGNYACEAVGVSCTGIGEHIIYQAVAARLAARIQDGGEMVRAARKIIAEAERFRYRFGFIALDATGETVVTQTTGYRQSPVRFARAYAVGGEIRVETWRHRLRSV